MRFAGLAVAALLLAVALPAAAAPERAPAAPNPLLAAWDAPFAAPPFGKIRPEHFLPAFQAGIAERRKEVEAIAGSPAPATFANTVEALENGGLLLSRVNEVFGTLTGAETNERLQAVNREVAPLLSALRDDIALNEKLFLRVRAVRDDLPASGLDPVKRRLVEETYRDFVRGGAGLPPEKKARLREVNGELSLLGIRFGDNLLKETNSFRLVVDRKEDLAGLPPAVVSAAASAAAATKDPALEGKWVYTLQAPSIFPFLTFAENRDLRKKILAAYASRGDHGDALDNKAVLSRIAALRSERAQLLGFPTHAAWVLDDNMAKTPAGVYGLLNRVWPPALAAAKRESVDLAAAMKADGKDARFEASDWRFYAERIRKARYDLDDQELRPYFALDRVREGAFGVATRLYGITFTERPDVPTYHPEVRTWEVKDADGTFLALYTADYHPRPGKRGGAWCGRIRSGRGSGATEVRPIVTNVTNFTRPAGDAPALLSLEEVRTLFHEFGHALAGILSRVPYRTLARTPRDYVELPSQIMENWALEPEVLKGYARHWKSGEPIPGALVAKIGAASRYGQGFATTEYMAAAFLDMDWHMLPDAKERDASAFEKESLARMGLIPEILVRYRSPYFNHVFGPGGGYAAGYYSYIWAEVLDADAYEAFREKGIFDPATALSFRRNILEKGGVEDVQLLYRAFSGKDPSIEPLLRKRGLAEPKG